MSKQSRITGSIKDFLKTRVLSPLARGRGFFILKEIVKKRNMR